MLRYGTEEYKEPTRRNRQRQTEFLNEENQIWLDRIFQDKGVRDKVKIDVGLHELTLRVLEKRKAKNGQDMMVIKFWKPPRMNMKGQKEGYDTIDCYSMLQKVSKEVFEEEWFKPFTFCLSEQDFSKVKRGQKFRCLVQHKEKYFTDKNGEFVRYEQGLRFGEPIIIREASIVKIFKDNEEPQIDYLKLFIPLNNGTNNI